MGTGEIAIYGAGGFAREVAWLVERCAARDGTCRSVCFIDDDEACHRSLLNDLAVMGLEEARQRFPDARVVGGLGSPAVRERVMEKAAAAGFGFATLIHPQVEHSRRVQFGAGTIVCAGSVLTVNISLGRHVQINLDCTIGHDVVMGDYTTLAPGVHVSGWVHFGRRVYVGTGAVIVNGTREAPILIGDDAIIGAGACVIRSVPAGETVVGVPARPLVRG